MKRIHWKRITGLMLAVLCLVTSMPLKVDAAEYWPEGPTIDTPSAIVMEVSTGTVLYEKNADQQLYPASITKIMTTLLAIENCSMDEIVTFSEEAVYNNEGDTSHISRDIGEQMTVEQCLYGIMLASANECAWAIAEHVGGTEEHFVEMMNEKAKELGCTNTHFNNPNGLPDEQHYTSARDMALISQAAYENETFRIITGTARYTIPPTNKHSDPTPLQNHNEMLYPWKYTQFKYEYCTGGKTGFTKVANSTLVTYAEKDGMTLVCVVMNTISPAQWLDSTTLFDYCFDNFQIWNIAENENRYENEVNQNVGSLNEYPAYAEIDSDAKIVLPKMAEFQDTTVEVNQEQTSDKVVGELNYTYMGRQVGKADIVVTDADVKTFDFDNVEDEEKKTLHVNPFLILLILLGVVALVVIFFVVRRAADNFYIMRHNLEVRKYSKKQKKRKKKSNLSFRSKRR